jgi:transketolase
MSNTDSAAKSQGSAYQEAVKAVRFLSVDTVEKADSGHPGAPMGLADIAVEIYAKHLRYNPQDPNWANRDRFVLSCGHASALLYSVLHVAGYDVTLDDLKSFRQWGSRTPGHPEFGHTKGVETTTGPLGQGLCNAVGLALASKMGGAQINADGETLIDYSVYAIASDGDLMEGVAYEACSLAGHLKLDNLIVVYDSNNVTIDGKADVSFTENIQKRFEAQGWVVSSVDGHNASQIGNALDQAKMATGPALIIAKTKIGFGAPKKVGTSGVHGSPLGPEELRASKEAAGWPLSPDFYVSDAAREAFAPLKKANKAAYDAWNALVGKLSGERKAALAALLNPIVPDNLLEQLVAAAGNEDDATRNHGGRVLQKVAELVPALAGGSADLNASTKTRLKASGDVTAGHYGERNINFGIREHGMGSILNGLALSGMFIPFCSTFLIFSDYMRPPMRLASLMKQRVVYVYTHDSIFLGEDGPTHQPVEQLWSMRLVPNLDVVRPADAMECAAAWAYAAARSDGPTVLSLTRHTVPALKRPEGFNPRDILKGGYILSDVDNPELVLIATGSEVCEAVSVQEILKKANRRVRVVSMPCVEAFQRLPKTEQDVILPPGVRRASFELGVTGPWKALTGLDGIEIGVDQFGASAPFEKLQEEYGVTAAQAAAKILASLG